MFYLLTMLAVIPSPVLMFINGEAWAVFIGLMGTRNWVLLALAIAAGQTIGFTLLYVFGHRWVSRWVRLQAAIDRFDREKLRRNAPWALSLGGLIGLPPHNVMAVLCPVVGVRYRLLFVTTICGRSIRYLILAGVPAYFSQYIDLSWMPEWLRALA